ncbi:EF-hand calcium-binding domain-containing protein 4B [Malaya genurostris]|uniref:EF-hand calcium-binding domain-containing protein 4B n=1 Tax=Malaya genurostris TaxID=325434 RepID=UPI0026F3FDA0|nr:EF-hand calcium-binding domain-containing protein 4B [Malaya genurostris]
MPPQILPSKMQSREHPFNRSTRPLLERRAANMAQPQVLSSKQINAKSPPTRGYNDFNLITRQYENLNSNKGYPYGSPPSPTHLNQIDFQFSDVNEPRYRPVAPAATRYLPASTNRNNSDHEDDDDEDDYDELVYHHNQLNVQQVPAVPRRRLIDASSPPVPPQRIIPVETSTPPSLPLPPPPPPLSRGDTLEHEGPFVFGVHHPNTFTPAYGKGKDTAVVVVGSSNGSPNSSIQNNSDISSRNTSSSEKERRALMKEKKHSKRTKKEKKTKTKSSTKPKEPPRSTKEPPNVKCVLVGDGAVGKTNLIVTYIQDRFNPEYVPTAFDKYNVDVSVDGRPICVTLCDTAGQDALDPLRQLCYPGSDVVLLCFSVVQPGSFRSVATKWEPEVARLKGCSLVLVGTQSDLRNDRNTILKLQAQGEKPVPVSAAWDFARKIGAKYIETSSHRKERIKEVFDTAIWDALQAREFDRKRPLWKRMFCLAC